jgi:non-specific serine/threonine protein kinase/serine/threonine-protein kinase
MQPERWKEIEDLCNEALERTDEKRVAFLRSACAGDEALLQEVQSLLAHEKQAGTFIETPALEQAAQAMAEQTGESDQAGTAPRLIGKMISHYRLVERIGYGGMGEVYRAIRADDQYQKLVALKLVKADFDTQFVLERFRNERQILAGLEHPNIARLIDGGTTEDGLPYFVMELVEGQPIDEYCESHRLSTIERLKLFRSVCSAVHYAHQHLVVHRDLKPSNILVTNEGVPKLLDFGIAKITDPEHFPRAVEPTFTAMRVMTLEYASPEQVRGETITTASDVYSLGVLLYYILTGHLPYRLTTRSPHEVARAICEIEPEKPSTAVSRVEKVPGPDGKLVPLTPELVSSTREGHPERLRRRLGGDLDQIVLMAIRKEKERRYTSVEQLSEDLGRYLEGRAVLAQKGTLSYRATKFVKRHKTGVIAAALAVLTLLAGMAAIVRESRLERAQRARAERRFNDVRDLANSLMFDINDSIANLPGATAPRKLLVTKALKYLDSLASEANGDSSLQRELATAYQKVGDIQGLLNGQQNVGHSSDALESYRKALAIREALAAADPSGPAAKQDLAFAYQRMGQVCALLNDFAGARENNQKAFEIYEALHAASPNDAKLTLSLASSYFALGRLFSLNGEWTPAVQNVLKAVALYEQASRAKPDDSAARFSLAAAYREACYDVGKAGDRPKALDLCREAVNINEALVAANPNEVRAHLDLASAYGNLGMILADGGDPAGAIQNWRKSLANAEPVVTADPNNARARVALALAENQLGLLLAKTGQTSDLNYELKALEIRKKLFEDDPKNLGRQEAVAVSYATLGDAEEILAARAHMPAGKQMQHWREARSWYQQALQSYLSLRSQTALRGEEAGQPGRMAQEIAKCDTMLRKVQSPVASETK